MENMREQISNKLTSERIQLVFQDEPIDYQTTGQAEYGTEEAIQLMYGIDAAALKTDLNGVSEGLVLSITDASIGVGAPSEGWLIDLYRIVTPKAAEIATWIVIGQLVYKICRATRKHLKTIGYKNRKPMLSMIAVEALTVKRFMRFRRKAGYFVEEISLFNGENTGIYEPWDVYMITFGKFSSDRTTVVFCDCFGRQKGKVSFKMKRKYKRTPSDDF